MTSSAATPDIGRRRSRIDRGKRAAGVRLGGAVVEVHGGDQVFEEYSPSGGLKLNPIPAGFVSIGKTGVCTFHRSDLAKVGIKETVAILIDRTTLRVGFKRAKPFNISPV